MRSIVAFEGVCSRRWRLTTAFALVIIVLVTGGVLFLGVAAADASQGLPGIRATASISAGASEEVVHPRAVSTPEGNAPAQPVGAASFAFPDPKGWAHAVFNQVLVDFFGAVSTALQDLVQSVLGSSLNFITQTPPQGSYANGTVVALWGAMRTVADAALALVAMWGGFQIMAGRHTATPYHEALELLPRLAVGAALVNTSLFWGQAAIELGNGLCGLVSLQGLPAWRDASTADQAIANVLATLIYLIAAMLLLLQMLMRLALVDLLLIAAPLGLVCWVLPPTYGWARWWAVAFANAVLTQPLQVVALKLGATLLTDLTPQSPDSAVLSLLLGVAVLSLTLRIPRLLRVATGDGLGAARLVVARQLGQALGGRAPAAAAPAGTASNQASEVA